MSFQTHVCLSLARLSLSAAMLPSSQGVPPHQNSVEDAGRQGAPAQVSLADLSGADVLLEASTAPKSGSAPAIESAESPKGKVVEVVLSTSDGQIVCAALSVGKLLGGDERVVLVPATVLQCTTIEKNPGYVLRMTKAELQSLSEFDPRSDGKEGLDRAVERARGLAADASGRKLKESGDSGKKDHSAHAKEAEGQGSALTAVPMYVLSSQLNDCELGASDGEFGKVHDAVVDVRGNTIGYLLVSHGTTASVGTTLCVVPLRACQWSRASGKTSLKVGKTNDQLKAVPEYKKPDLSLLTPEQMKSADALFGTGKTETPNPQ
jgi:hypothetical protein